MSKLYKKTTLFVSRCYYHGGDGLENHGLRFFRSKEEYDKLEEEGGWKSHTQSLHTGWCTPPVPMEALVSQKDLVRFQQGQILRADRVFFAGTRATAVHRVGGLQ